MLGNEKITAIPEIESKEVKEVIIVYADGSTEKTNKFVGNFIFDKDNRACVIVNDVNTLDLIASRCVIDNSIDEHLNTSINHQIDNILKKMLERMMN